MSTMTLSAKRQVVLPAQLCEQVALAPGDKVEVCLSPDGSGILIQSATAQRKKPASVLFDRFQHRGTPVQIEDIQGLAAAKKSLREAAS
jgi:bifunctional DNA-binding transcriptional regulator/antitoxin component of YhaV-PrlF toxin-antitoxin module